MSEDYIFFAEDFYQTCILDYYAKNRRILRKYLYVYVIGTGITSEKTFSKESVRKRILSSFNIEKNLSTFYKKNKEEKYIKQVKDYSLEIYLGAIDGGNKEDFIECCKEVLDEAKIEDILLTHSKRNENTCKKQSRISSIFAKIKRHLKRRFRCVTR